MRKYSEEIKTKVSLRKLEFYSTNCEQKAVLRNISSLEDIHEPKCIYIKINRKV